MYSAAALSGLWRLHRLWPDSAGSPSG
jgi:hypothetical protein